MHSGRRKVLRGPRGGSGPAQSVDQANGGWTVTIDRRCSNLASFKGGLWSSLRHWGTAPGPYAVVPTTTGAWAWGALGDGTSQLSGELPQVPSSLCAPVCLPVKGLCSLQPWGVYKCPSVFSRASLGSQPQAPAQNLWTDRTR